MRHNQVVGGFLLVVSFTLFLFGAALADPPSSFDLRDVGGNNYVSSVKSQQGGTCWTHGAMASMEGSLLMTGAWAAAGESGEPNLAEYHLDWWNGFNTFNNDDDPGGGGLTVHQGGDYLVTSAYLSRAEGAVRDVDGQSYSVPPDRHDPSYHYYYARDIEWYVAGADLSNINTIKEKIMANGVMGTCVCYSGSFIDGDYNHYQPPSSTYDPNHAVAIMGWDDNRVTQAPEDGAWLCKNSWGSDWGLDGCFWISYYDKHSCQHPEMGAVSLYNVEPLAHDHIYYHDYHGWRDTKEDCSEAFNAFTGTEDGEMLVAVSFYTAGDSVNYTVKIYDRFEGGELLDELSTKSGFIEFTGFHTVDLDAEVTLSDGDDFYIYLVLSSGGQPYDRTSEVPVLLGARYLTIVESEANPGESYYWKDTSWMDLYYWEDPPWTGTANFCIKGLAVATGLRVDPATDFESEGSVGGPFSPSSAVYQLVNRNDYAISYEVTADTAPWLTLSGDLTGILSPFDTAEVTAEMSSYAGMLGQGVYLADIYFTNLTDHVGDTTRHVQLVVGEPSVRYEWALDTDPGWTTEGEWAFGQPTGSGGEYGGPDPTSGYTGDNVYGYNLYGDYGNNLPERHLTSTPVDCSGLFKVHLKFWRWLGVESPSYDHAYVRVSSDGTNWVTVWGNTAEITDGSWTEMVLDISDVADDQSAVYVRWTMGPTDTGWRYCGWNIDDIRIAALELGGGVCGDANGDEVVDLADVVYLINYLLMSGEAPHCAEPYTGCVDANGDGEVNLADVVYLINYVLKSGPPPLCSG